MYTWFLICVLVLGRTTVHNTWFPALIWQHPPSALGNRGAGKCPVRRLQRIEYIYLIATPLPEADIHRITKWAIISNEGSQPVVQKSFNTGQSLLLCWPRLSTLDNQLRSLPRSLLRMGIVRSRSTFLVTFRPYLVVYGRFSGRE